MNLSCAVDEQQGRGEGVVAWRAALARDDEGSMEKEDGKTRNSRSVP